MKILIVTQQAIPHEGGLSTHVIDLIAGLRGAGHEVALIEGRQAIAPKWMRLLLAALSGGNHKVYRHRVMSDTLRRLRRLVAEEVGQFQPDLLHCHDVYAGSAVAQALGNTRVPVVETVHGPALYEHRQMSGAGWAPRVEQQILDCERTAFAAATALIAVDSGQAEILRRDYAVEAERITVIFNSVNVEDVRKSAAGEAAFKPDGKFFLVPRRLVPKTGVRYAIEALAKMRSPDTRLVIAGQGPLRGELEELTASLGLTERVHFLGPVPRAKLMPLFAGALGVLVPSVPTTGVIEATSLAVMEAMACGSVPIASAIGGLAELIDDGETGLLVPPADAEALGLAMSSVAEDAHRRTQLLASGKHKVETDYSTEAWLKRVLRVYEHARTKLSVTGGIAAKR